MVSLISDYDLIRTFSNVTTVSDASQKPKTHLMV